MPLGWAPAALGDLLRGIEAGRSFTCDSRPPGPNETGVVKVSAVTWGIYDEAEAKTCTDPLKVNDAYLIQPGDFLFSRANTVELVGACVIVPGISRRIMLSDKILRLLFRDSSWQKWTLWFLRSRAGRHQIEALATGNQESMRNIGQDRIRRIELPLPPAAERDATVAEIEKQFTRLDAAVATLEGVRAKLKRARASVLKAAVEGRLVPTEAKLARQQGRPYEPAPALLAGLLETRRQAWPESRKYKPPVEPRPDLPVTPEGWALTTVDALQVRITSGSRDWTRFQGSGSGTFLLAQNVRPMRLDLSMRQSVAPPPGDAAIERSRVAEGDLLVTIVGANTGQVCRVPHPVRDHFVCQSVALVRPVAAGISSFLEVWLNSQPAQAEWRTLIYGQGRPHLGLDDIEATSVALPPLAEQERIVAEVERRLSVLEALERTVEQNLTRCARLRQSILKRAFEGRLVPQDPTDEPASALLARLRTTRESTSASASRRVKKPGRRPKAKA